MLTTRDILNRIPMSEDDRALLLTAVATRGKNKDALKATAPSVADRPHQNAAWNALVSNLAPQRVQLTNLMLHSEVLETFNRLDAIKGLDIVRFTERPFRWNANEGPKVQFVRENLKDIFQTWLDGLN